MASNASGPPHVRRRETASHRRERQQRSIDRTILRIESARACLEAHHGSTVPAFALTVPGPSLQGLIERVDSLSMEITSIGHTLQLLFDAQHQSLQHARRSTVFPEHLYSEGVWEEIVIAPTEISSLPQDASSSVATGSSSVQLDAKSSVVAGDDTRRRLRGKQAVPGAASASSSKPATVRSESPLKVDDYVRIGSFDGKIAQVQHVAPMGTATVKLLDIGRTRHLPHNLLFKAAVNQI